ncbi:hypothetical protein BKA70DRAFT_1370459 [Coprinopsis sp. MPI-PUGE-AT-0042]|nr:hypothetical protein BKA70DRAFT_1370459 [Coprinopsis sp. MPI-PUGE-AT-0042]
MNTQISLSMNPTQLLKLLRSLPGLTIDNSNLKQDAAQTLSNLAQAPYGGQLPYPPPPPPGAGMSDPGSSSQARGPPPPPPPEGSSPISQGAGSAPSGRRGRNPAIGTDEWTRQRKDNHKEVERRRRGNINDGINELGRIVPNGTGEKAKGAILARAVQYIHHLKENEAPADGSSMGDLQAQLEEVKRLWDEERTGRQRLESELEHLRGRQQGGQEEGGGASAAKCWCCGEVDGGAGENPDADRDGKRQRVE